MQMLAFGALDADFFGTAAIFGWQSRKVRAAQKELQARFTRGDRAREGPGAISSPSNVPSADARSSSRFSERKAGYQLPASFINDSKHWDEAPKAQTDRWWRRVTIAMILFDLIVWH
jgi:hypothetical protein